MEEKNVSIQKFQGGFLISMSDETSNTTLIEVSTNKAMKLVKDFFEKEDLVGSKAVGAGLVGLLGAE